MARRTHAASSTLIAHLGHSDVGWMLPSAIKDWSGTYFDTQDDPPRGLRSNSAGNEPCLD